jgi:colicin import membrane protein
MVAEQRDFSVGLRRSMALHAAIAVLILFKSFVMPGKSIPIVPTLRVDIVGLPDVLKKDLPQLNKRPPSPEIEAAMKKAEAEIKKKEAPKPEEKAEPAEKDEMVLKPKKASEQEPAKARERKNKNALDRIKALAKLGVDTPQKEAVKEKPAGQLIKGNAISKGTSLAGDAKENAAATYYDILRDRLQENWALPVWLARQKLSARIQIFIDSQGRLKAFKFLKGSGNAQFDEAVKKAIQDSQPFPAPPSELAGSVLADGVLVGFPL